MNVGRSRDDLGALMVISTSAAVPADVAQRLEEADGVANVSIINLAGA